jgi:hypothetical protein
VDQGDSCGGGDALIWSPELAPANLTAANGGGLLRHQATNDSKHKERFQEIGKLTRMLKRCPNTSIETGDELKLADSGEHLWKGIAKI